MFCGRIILAVSLLGSSVWAQTDTSTALDVQIGWGDQVHNGRWGPLFVTASNSKPRNVVLNVYWPHDNTYALKIEQRFAIGPQPVTFPIYIPMGTGDLEASLTLRDLRTDKVLAEVQPYQVNPATGLASYGSLSHGKLIGLSGKRSGERTLDAQFSSDQRVGVGFLEPPRLPESAIGYDCLDILLLNQPDLNPVSSDGASISIEAQQAIVDWVRAGGCLLLSPGSLGIPNQSPIFDILPCAIGEDYIARRTNSKTGRPRLSLQSEKLSARRLVPKAGSAMVPLFGEGIPPAFMRRIGLGTVLVAPVSLAEFQFDDTAAKDKFWKPIFESMGIAWEEPNANQNAVYNFGYAQPGSDEQLEQTAAEKVTDALGNVPGAGNFGFSYVATALIGMMIVVGPLDWFVLRKLGREPYTWLTTSAWITLTTLGALFVGHLVKSGDLYYRTLRLIDQAGNQTVGTIDVAGIYSPRTAAYTIQTDQGWWQPTGMQNLYMRSGSWKTPIDFHQTSENNLPEAMSINVWNLRFLRGDTIAAGAPLLSASLSEIQTAAGSGRPKLVGTIRNLTDHPLANVRLATDQGEGDVMLLSAATAPTSPGQIPPGAEVRVETQLTPVPKTLNSDPQYIYYQQLQTNGKLDEKQMWWLSPRRTNAIAAEMKRNAHAACVYARVVDTTNPCNLDPRPQVEENWQWVRALVELKDSKAGTP